MPTALATDTNHQYIVHIHQDLVNEDEVEFQNMACYSDYNYGVETGKRLKTVFSFLNLLTRSASSQEAEEIQDEIDTMDEASLNEIEGFAEYLDISTPRTYFLISQFLNLFSDSENACTTSVSTKDATFESEKFDTYLTQNIDVHWACRIFYRYFAQNPHITHRLGANKYAFFGVPIFQEVPFINDKNLGMGGNGLNLDPDYTDYYLGDLLTKTTRRLYRESMMDCDTVDQVVVKWESADRSGGRVPELLWMHGFDNSNTAWVDANGDIQMIEQTDSYFKSVSTNQDDPTQPDIIWHTNHHLWNDEPTCSLVPDTNDSTWLREQEAKEWLSNHYRSINFNFLQNEFTQYHGNNGPDYGDICRHKDLDEEEKQKAETMFSWIVEPKNSYVYWTPAATTPCEAEYYFHENMEVKFDQADLDISGKKILLAPTSYQFEIGSIPYLLQESQQDTEILGEYRDEEENTSLIISAFLSDVIATSNNIQRNHDYSISLSKTDYDPESFCSNISLTVDGVVNASLSTDDTANHTWRSIQKAIDNLSMLDILVIEKGIYSENITVNKSIIILGADENNVIINGFITMINPHDYILLNITDPIMNVNMTGVQCLFHFDNTSDTNRESSGLPLIVHDYSPLKNDGTNHNATFTTSTIKGSSAFHFNGINSSINLTGIPALIGKNTTISAWIHWTSSNHSDNPIISQSNQTEGYCLLINGTTNTPLFRLGNHMLLSNTTINNGWHFIVGTHNANLLRLYVDGVMTNSTITSDAGINTTAFIGTDNATNYFDGIIDEVAVWNRTLSSSEIMHLYGLNYGVVLDGITIQNSDIGITPVNHSDITNCHLLNTTTGISIDNLCDLKIQCNFTGCDTALNLIDSNPDDDNRIRLMDNTISQSANGFHINSSSNLDIIRTFFNCTIGPLVFTQCNYSTINIEDTWAWGNCSPDQPSLSGPNLGNINTPYTFYTRTNDTNQDDIFYQFDWGDGNTSGWLGPYQSNQTISATHSWVQQGGYHVQVQAKDIFYNTSDSSQDILFRTEILPPIIHSVQCQPVLVTAGWSTTITANVSDNTSSNWSGISQVTMNITYPDQRNRNLTLSQITNNTYEFIFPETWLFGQYNYIIWATDNAENNKCSSAYSFTVSHTLGDTYVGSSNESVQNVIRGSRFNLTEDALVHNITAYVRGVASPTFNTPTYQCMIYRVSDGHLMGSTAQEEQTSTGWHTFSFNPRPALHHDTQYYLTIWGDNAFASVYCSPMNPGNGYSNSSHTFGIPPQTIGWNLTSLTQYSIFCIYTTDIYPPQITSVNGSPHTVGFGYNITITTNITDNGSGINLVNVRITEPGNQTENYTMAHISGDMYRYTFSETWQTGQYNFSIWAQDNDTNINTSSTYHFHVSTQATISIATLKNSYSGTQYINLTDPPNPTENLTVVGRGLTWNTYYNASTGENILEAYQGPVNYQENNNSWTPINNTISQLATNHPAYVYGYRKGNDRGLFGAYFKSNAQNDWPVAFTYNRSDDPSIHAVRSKLVGVGYVDPQNNWAYQYLQNVQSSQGQTSDYSITYPGVFTGTDVTWSYGNTGMKEEITMSNTTKTVLQNHPPSQYGLNDASSYLIFITKLDYQNLNLYNGSGLLDGNVTISDTGIDFKDILGQFKCALPLGEAYELNNESVRQKLTYRIVHLNGNTYLLSGLKVSKLNTMTFPVVIDPTLTVYSSSSDGYIYKSGTVYTTVQSASTGTVNSSGTYITIGQRWFSGLPGTYYIYRGFVFFNTSALPNNAYLDNATLSIYKKDDYSTTDFDITIQNGQPTYPHNPMQSNDYNRNYYSGNGGSLNTSRFGSGYNAIALSNLNWINKTGITKLCLRSSKDISGTAPTGSEYINIQSSEFLGMCPPKLVINYRNQSKIKNIGSTNIKGYLLIQVQYYDPGKGVAPRWVVDNNTVNETTPRTINSGNQLGLDTVFNGKIRASNLQHGTGTYRVYAAFRNPDGNILKTNTGVEVKAWWQFSKT